MVHCCGTTGCQDLAQHGETAVYVPSRSEVEDLFLGLYQGSGYRNSTSMSATEAKEFFGRKQGTYHWDDQVGADGGVLGHEAGNPDAKYRHLQIHTHEGVIIRIFFGPPLTWP